MDVSGVPLRDCSPMPLRALRMSASIAPLLRPGASGSVVATYRRAVDLRLGGRAVVLVTESLGEQPHGILLPEAVLDGWDVRRGASVHVRPGLLEVAGTLRLSLPATVWDPRLGPLTPHGGVARIGLAVAALQAAREAAPAGHGTGAGRAPWSPVTAAARALTTGDAALLERAGAALIGLGTGLTPAGDDVLVGFTAALTALGHSRARPIARAWADAARARTTTVAETFHLHAAAGEYSGRLHELLRALLAGPPAAIPDAIHRAATWGATSGWDTLLGVELGLRCAVAGTADAGRAAA